MGNFMCFNLASAAQLLVQAESAYAAGYGDPYPIDSPS